MSSMPRLARAVVRIVSALALISLFMVWYFGPNPKLDSHRLDQAQNKLRSVSRALVVASLQHENTRWATQELDDHDLRAFVYIVDNSSTEYHVPQNKDHEAMVYLTYIIDHYDTLPDVVIFTHAERYSSHGEELLDNDLVRMIGHLKYATVLTDGYFNLRCNWNHGCPKWLNLLTQNNSDAQSVNVRDAWNDIHGAITMPDMLAQPCCSQFAASRDAIHSVPRGMWAHYRGWLLRTELDDYASGRVWEYMWQYVLTGQGVFCPAMSKCYCEGYGICFGSEDQFERWWAWFAESKEWFLQYLRLKADGQDDWNIQEKLRLRNEMLQKYLDEAILRGNPAL